LPTNLQLPYCYNTYLNVHNNSVTLNSSIGDELFSGTPAGAGGVTFNAGSDSYSFRTNWVCGNLSSGDGGGVAHLGFSWNGDIEHNTILFNQSTNPTIATNGGGIVVMGAAPDGSIPGVAATECGSVTDIDCAPGLSDGTGPNLVINANLIQANGAESGSGGGIRLQTVNGAEIAHFPISPAQWNSVTVTNNIISNNVAGWDGGGISLQDALKVDIVNNTVASNDATASSGVLFNTLGAPIASTPPPGCNPQTGAGCTDPVVTSNPQVAGLVTMENTPNLIASLPAQITCPPGNSAGSSLLPQLNGSCRQISYPLLYNNVFWQNRTFNITVGGYSNAFQQNVVSLVPVLNQPSADSTAANGAGVLVTGGIGACVVGANYWDIGVRGDTGPTNHSSGFTLDPIWSVITDASDYTTMAPSATNAHNTGSNPQVISQYCNGSKVPPENGGLGYQVPPGIADATVPNPIFNLTPSATVDEGNNWINMSWGPLAMTNPVVTGTDGNYGGGALLGNYALSPSSSAIDYVPNTPQTNFLPQQALDFFGNPRPDPANPDAFDVGAVESQLAARPHAFVTGGPLNFGNVNIYTTSAPFTLTLHNDGNATLTGITLVFAPTVFSQPSGAAGGTCGVSLAPGSTCTINVVFTPMPPAGAVNGSLTISGNAPVGGSPVGLTGTAVAVPFASVTGGPLAFGNVAINTISAPQTLTLSNTGAAPLTGITYAFSSAVFSQPAASPGTCGAVLAAGSPAVPTTCTIKVVFSPTALGTANATLTIIASAAVTGSPVSLSGVGVLPILDNFNRATTTTLNDGTLWSQVVVGGFAAIQVNDATPGNVLTGQAFCSNVPSNPAFPNFTPCVAGGAAYWNTGGVVSTGFGSRQAAQFTFSNATLNGASLALKATGAIFGQATLPQNFIRVQYNSGAQQITVATTTNGGGAFTTAGTLGGFGGFASGNMLTASVDQTGLVTVRKNVTTVIGTVQLPNVALWTTGGGRIGMQLPNGARVDDFSGANLP
jgi:hypothetical protein